MFDLAVKLKSVIDGTSNILKVVDKFESYTTTEKKEYIDQSFKKQLEFAFDHVPYYHRKFIDYGLDRNKFTSISNIKSIPILTKDDIRDNQSMLKSDIFDKIKVTKRRSGGTTGEPIESYLSIEAQAFETFGYFKGLRWMGWSSNMTMVKIFGGSLGVGKSASFRDKVYNKVINSVFIPAFEVDSTNIKYYYDKIKTRRNLCLIGYASAVDNFITLLKNKELLLKNIGLAITTSEQLLEDWRINISDYCNCEVRSYYGCGEIGSLGYQVKDGGDGYKIPVEHVYIDSNNGNFLLNITQLHNVAQPLIRYENGDLGVLNENFYSDKIEKLLGREADNFSRKDGSVVSASFAPHSVFRSGLPVNKYQYIQYNNGIIEFKYTMPSGELNSSQRKQVMSIIEKVMGEPTQVVFNRTDDFVVSNSKKHRICVKLDQDYQVKFD